MQIKSLFKSLTPPTIWETACWANSRLKKNQIRFVGNFTSWADAEAASTGSAARDILESTIESVRKIKNGEAAFERDGVSFAEMEYNFPVAWALIRATARHRRLHVLDFGGALGATYYQIRAMVDASPPLRWAIVEQPAHVAAGMREFASEELSWHDTIEAACQEADCDVLLLSGVIQYLPDPLGFLDYVLSLGFSSIILDRAPFMVDGFARLIVQHVPPSIYSASYPAWFLAEADVRHRFAGKYDLIASWSPVDNAQPDGGRAVWIGFLFEGQQKCRKKEITPNPVDQH